MVDLAVTELTKLYVVVVLYKMLPADSPTLQTLINSSQQTPDLQIDLLIWDNTPRGQSPGNLPGRACYIAAPHNPGLATAYNFALDAALAAGREWILTLDQDTALPLDFLTKILHLIRGEASSKSIAAIVPGIIGDGRQLSPFHLLGGALPRHLPPGFRGLTEDKVYALNSAATLRVSALKEIGGYNPLFPLDISDLDVFHRLQLRGKRVFVAGDIVVSHDFSLLKKHARMSIERYRSQLLDECAFWDLNMSPLARCERLVRLVGRWCKDVFSSKSLEFRRITAGEIKRRVITPRGERIKQWRVWAEARQAAAESYNLDTHRSPLKTLK
jgi:GT2 family glycosyltransferase